MQLANLAGSRMLLKQLVLLLLMLLMLHQLALLYCVERSHKTILQQSSFIWTFFFNTFVMAGQLHSEEHIRAMRRAAESMGIPSPPAAIFPGPGVAHVTAPAPAPAPAQQEQQQQFF
jgi:predicted MFS family arabinose efflux permease